MNLSLPDRWQELHTGSRLDLQRASTGEAIVIETNPFRGVLMKPSCTSELVREITVVHFGMGRETLSFNVKLTYFPWRRS
jgi:hypothetical protein